MIIFYKTVLNKMGNLVFYSNDKKREPVYKCIYLGHFYLHLNLGLPGQ